MAIIYHLQTMSMAARLRYFINSPTGPKTTHFWGPVANWGFVLAVRTSLRLEDLLPPANVALLAMADMQKPADVISINMTSALSIYSLIFMRFAWMVKPRNYLLLACHASNETAQLYQLQRGLRYQASKKAEKKE
ncbi:Mitochondrial pyruvate carrier 1 [Phytophthora citrophthora]|uniref:Mitochondrial pyruvate carrier n=1 Tax=Phytophthora citrophthora TaxID=4793 RepID=A0AAD9GGR8_9STRA|nr:Mitochondrial pyruvate carrier 1 [Phytophthora citrophthora]